MSELEELEEKISALDKQIRDLEKRRKKLHEYMLTLDIPEEQKIYKWFTNGEEKFTHANDLFQLETKAPKFREFIKTKELDRYRKYDILDWFFTDIDVDLLSPEDGIKYHGKEKYEQVIKEFIEYGGELMKANIKSFTCDW